MDLWWCQCCPSCVVVCVCMYVCVHVCVCVYVYVCVCVIKLDARTDDAAHRLLSCLEGGGWGVVF